MEKLELTNLFEAIKKDDVKSFSLIMLSNSDLNICFGRFPLLSLCYLYGSYKILEKYEKLLLPIHNFVVVDEFYEMYLKFKKHARKALKIYVLEEKIIYPIEMLAILDERFLLCKYFKSLFKNEEILINLRKIYKINKNIDIEVSLNDIVIPKKKLNFKQKVITAVSICLMVVMIAVSCGSVIFVKDKFGIGTAKNPIKISTEAELQKAVSKGVRCYVLEKDIILTKEWEPDNFKGAIYGDGHTIFAGEYLVEGFIGKLTGIVQDLTIETEFNKTSVSSNYGILAKNSTGTIKNCGIFGDFEFEAYSDEEIYVSIFVAENNGLISNCSADVSVNINNNRSSNVFLSVFAGVNNGTIENSKTIEGEFVADTVDLGGIAVLNNGTIKNCINNTKLTQTSSKEWHPNTAGICTTNYGTIDACKNYADVLAESTKTTALDSGDLAVICGGVACDNYGVVKNSRNYGKVTAKGLVSVIYAGGICARNILDDDYANVSKSKAECEIVAYSRDAIVSCGGVVGYNMSEVKNCGFIGSISATNETVNTTSPCYAGGVVGYNRECMLEDSYAKVTFVGTYISKTNALVGGVVGCVGTVRYEALDGYSYTAYGVYYVSNNHFVLDASFSTPAYGISSTVIMGNVLTSEYVQATADTETFISHQLLTDISSEVLLND